MWIQNNTPIQNNINNCISDIGDATDSHLCLLFLSYVCHQFAYACTLLLEHFKPEIICSATHFQFLWSWAAENHLVFWNWNATKPSLAALKTLEVDISITMRRIMGTRMRSTTCVWFRKICMMAAYGHAASPPGKLCGAAHTISIHRAMAGWRTLVELDASNNGFDKLWKPSGPKSK